MNKFKLYNRLCLFITTLILSCTLTSCLKEDLKATYTLQQEKVEPPADVVYPPDVEQKNGTTSSIASTSTSAKISQGGYLLSVPAGAVPRSSSGNEGKVMFSVNVSEELPAPLPAGVSIGSKLAKVEPFNFNFNYPFSLAIPVQNRNLDSKGFAVYHYNEEKSEWLKVLNSGLNSADKTINVSATQAGYYILAEDMSAPKKEEGFGGIRLNHPQQEGSNYFYTITILNSELTFAGQTRTESGSIARTLCDKNGKPLDYTYLPDLPQGNYELEIARERRTSADDASTSLERSTSNVKISINKPLNKGANKLDMSTWLGWADLNLQSVSFAEGRPTSWGEPTKTYGTGKFQATLTWVNSAGSETDYDLHLYGPKETHVYFGKKTSSSFELDRDWLKLPGNAIENIYSIKDYFPSGEYQVKVNLFSGSIGKEFNIRIIQDGVVVKSERAKIDQVNGMYNVYSFIIDNGDQPEPEVPIKKVASIKKSTIGYSESSTVFYDYDEQGRIMEIHNVSQNGFKIITKINYSANKVHIVGGNFETETFDWDGKKVTAMSNPENTNKYYISSTINYSGEYIAKSTYKVKNTAKEVITSYTWNDGNLSEILNSRNGGSEIFSNKYTYGSQKNTTNLNFTMLTSIEVNPIDTELMMMNLLGASSKLMPSSMSFSTKFSNLPQIYTYTYTTDAQGNIITITNNDYNYLYEITYK